MSRILPPFAALRAFEAAAESLSFKQAALSLALTPSAISHQIKGLETHLGVTLFDRKSRTIQLTAAGQALLPQVQKAFDLLEQAASEISEAPQGVQAVDEGTSPPKATLKIFMPVGGLSYGFSTLLAKIAQDHQEALAAFTLEYETYEGLQPDPLSQEEGISLSFCALSDQAESTPGQADATRMSLGAILPLTLLCSPKLTTGPGALTSLERLSFQSLLHSRERPLDWPLWLQAHAVPTEGAQGVLPDRGPRFDTTEQALTAAVLGMGVALALPGEAEALIASEKLVQPFESAVIQPYENVLRSSADFEAKNPLLQTFYGFFTEI